MDSHSMGDEDLKVMKCSNPRIRELIGKGILTA